MSQEKDYNAILATDCGSTTTKAILIEKRNNEYRLRVRGEAPTTVEAPFEDVTRGVLNAVREVEELSNRDILEGEKIVKPALNEREGIDTYVSTSSAGGGLQMLVVGVVKSMTAESAARAALGAGAIVMETIAVDDGRLPHEKIQLIRHLRPDMILLSGGVDGGTITHVVQMAQIIAAADPKPRFGLTYKLPVIYAGNKDARDEVKKILGDKFDLHIVENIRPRLEEENLIPARNKIHELFMEHVMSQAPGYRKLMDWVDAPIMPTPGAVGLLVHHVAKKRGIDVIGVDIGGATTDIFSVFKGTFNRTVSANLGMSYSISNVLVEAGLANIKRWLPFDIGDADLCNRIKNKMIRPTTIPQTIEELKIEQAIAREALRLAFLHHKTMAVELKGVQRQRTISDVFIQEAAKSLINMMSLALIIGSGGVLSHAPRRVQAAMMLLDAFQPEGITQLAVDSIFMMPHLGVLTTVHERAALEVFDKDCLIRLGTAIAPVGDGKEGEEAVKVELPNQTVTVKFGEINRVPLEEGQKVKVRIIPGRKFDVGNGRGRELITEVEGGVVGLLIDARGRPLKLPEDNTKRKETLVKWFESVDMYPK